MEPELTPDKPEASQEALDFKNMPLEGLAKKYGLAKVAFICIFVMLGMMAMALGMDRFFEFMHSSRGLALIVGVLLAVFFLRWLIVFLKGMSSRQNDRSGKD